MRFLVILLVLVATVGAKSWKSQTGLKIEVLETPEKCDKVAKYGDNVAIEYRGTLEDGKLFSGTDILGQYGPVIHPFEFQLGLGEVIMGWDEGIMGMCVGEKRRLTVPPELGYGSQGAGSLIPGGATTYYYVELISAVKGKPKVNQMFLKAIQDMNLSTKTMLAAFKPVMMICRMISSCPDMIQWSFDMDIDTLEKKVMAQAEKVKDRL